MRSLESVGMYRSDLAKIYEQLEHPEILANNWETGGWWFMDCYRIRNGHITMINLRNPPFEILEVSSVEMSLQKNEAGYSYFKRKVEDFISLSYSAKETLWAMRRYSAEKLTHPNALPPVGMVFDYNWHKHCSSTLMHPSGGDINEAAPEAFIKSPNLQTFTWAIVTPLSRSDYIPMSHQVIFGDGARKYVLSLWALNRDPEDIHTRYTYEDLRTINVRIID